MDQFCTYKNLKKQSIRKDPAWEIMSEDTRNDRLAAVDNEFKAKRDVELVNALRLWRSYSEEERKAKADRSSSSSSTSTE
jgi:hypothetical protein